MSISVDPLGLIKDYMGNRRERKDLEKLLNRHYRIQAGQGSVSGKLVEFQKIGANNILVIEINGKQSRINLNNVTLMQEIGKEEYEFPKKLDELISLSILRAERRPSFLSWIMDCSKPLRDSAIKWFDFEMAQVKKQIEILMLLFSHRQEYQNWKEEASRISSDFRKSIDELDKVIELIENKKVEKIEDIYEKHSQVNLDDGSEEKPNIENAFTGIFSASQNLDILIKKVENAISNIQDTVTIAKIQLSRDKQY